MFLEKARHVGDVLLRAYDTESGIPLARIVPAEDGTTASSMFIDQKINDLI